VARKFKSLLNLLTLQEDPISGNAGDVFFNTNEKALKIHNGVDWVILSQNTDPAPFYMHTHSYDGDVHTVNLQDTITFTEINNSQSVNETIPAIIGLDGGSPNSTYSDPNFADLTLLDGGEVGN
jgi:hypothetical protein